MSTQILIKRSTTTGAVPTTSDIAVGELAINTVDKRIFTNNSGTIVELGTTPTTQAVTGNASVGGTFDVVGAVTVGNFTADGTVDLTAATVTIPAPTADTHPATKKYVDDEVNAILDGAPAALNTLNEIAAAINDDANLYTTLTNSIATKLSLAGGTMTGSIDMGANSITTSADPATSNTLTRKSYVDGLYQSTVDAEVSAANALASEQAAATSASNASTSASASATSATASASSATNAASSATAAASSATSSANSATASATSATQSAASATQAQALVDSIESFYLGAEASAPTVDDNGDPLQAGDWYFNTTDNTTYIYNGSSWQSVSPDLVSDLTPQLGGNLDTNGNDINFGDNDKAIFGAGSDLQIYHTGAHSYIDDTGTGNLYINSNGIGTIIQGQGNTSARFFNTGAADLYYNGSAKLATTSTGIDVTGTATMDGLTVDGTGTAQITSTSGTTLELVRSGTAGQISSLIMKDGGNVQNRINSSNGALEFEYGASNLNALKIDNNGDISFYEDTGTTAKFFWDASAESLGIGTTSPAYSLDIQKGTTVIGRIQNTASTADAALITTNTAGSGQFGVNATGPYVFTAQANAFQVYTSNQERMRITSSGNVGIGTASPTQALTVNGNISLADDNTMIVRAASGRLAFNTNGFERLRITETGNVGIGTSSPESLVHINGSSAGALVDVLKLDNQQGSINTEVGMTFECGVDRIARISAANTGSDIGPLKFWTAGSADTLTERMRLDSSGNLLVGTTDSNLTDNTTGGGVAAQASGALTAARQANTPLYVNRTGASDGTLIDLRKDGATVGSIGTQAGYLGIGTGDTGIRFTDDEDTLVPWNASTTTARDAAINLGKSSHRFKDLYLSGGVYLGGTGAANYLDDYEEGTFTPSFVTAPSSGTVSSLSGKYTKIGNFVRLEIEVVGSNMQIASFARIQGLPFSVVGDGSGFYSTNSIAANAGNELIILSGTSQLYLAKSTVSSSLYKISITHRV